MGSCLVAHPNPRTVIIMTVKKCYKCDVVKDFIDFHKNKGRADGLQSYCKDCAQIRNREYYLSTPERNPQRRESSIRARDSNRDFIWDYLASHPCVDCGAHNPVVLEFDHIRGEKRASISTMVGSHYGSIEKLKEEVKKCVVRCANCHRIVTSQRGGWWKSIR